MSDNPWIHKYKQNAAVKRKQPSSTALWNTVECYFLLTMPIRYSLASIENEITAAVLLKHNGRL